MNLLHRSLQELKAVHASGAGVKETSYYPAVSGLFNAVGKTLKPAVRCIINLKNTGAGIPDGGFFTPDQVGERSPLPPPLPTAWRGEPEKAEKPGKAEDSALSGSPPRLPPPPPLTPLSTQWGGAGGGDSTLPTVASSPSFPSRRVLEVKGTADDVGKTRGDVT